MSIFVVFRVQDPARMKTAVETRFPNNYFALGSNEWLLSANGTAKDIATRLGVTDKPAGEKTDAGNAIVFSMANYYGRAASDIWDWIKTKAESTDG